MKLRDGLINVSTSMNSFLMIGQSNMAGRGHFNEVDPIKNPLCHMLRMGRWQAMSAPVNPDRNIFNPDWHSGICLAESFADDFAKEFGQPIGLIPCADGGTSMNQWAIGGVLYDHAVALTKLAMRSSSLQGILWHQGESECYNDELVATYKERFIAMVTQLRKDLGNENIPVIIGELSENIGDAYHYEDRPKQMNEIFRDIAATLPFCEVASAADLTLNSDKIHFDSKSLRIFGSRYFDAYKKCINKK